MKTFEVVGEIDTVALKLSYGETWHGIRLTPPFHISADSNAEALRIAKDIIDPLHLCTIKFTVTEQPSSARTDSQQLTDLLYEIVAALNGSSDTEHAALYSTGNTVATMLGVSLQDLLDGDGL